MKAQKEKLSGCASNLLAHEDLGHLRKPIIGIYKPTSIMKFPLVYESDNSRDFLYEEHGATLKHKCGKRIVTLPLLSFSLIFLFSLFYYFFGGLLWPPFLFGLLWPLLFFIKSGVSSRLVGES